MIVGIGIGFVLGSINTFVAAWFGWKDARKVWRTAIEDAKHHSTPPGCATTSND